MFAIKQKYLFVGVAFSSHTPLTKEEMIARRNRAFTVIDSAVPSILTKILGNDFKVGFTSILELLQNPLYNKQVSTYLTYANIYAYYNIYTFLFVAGL